MRPHDRALRQVGVATNYSCRAIFVDDASKASAELLGPHLLMYHPDM
jgi:hypothetical protein